MQNAPEELKADERARRIIAPWFYCRRHLRTLTRHWSERPIFGGQISNELRWKQLLEIIHKPICLRVTEVNLSVLDGPFPIPIIFLSEAQCLGIRGLTNNKPSPVFHRKIRLEDGSYEKNDFEFNIEISCAINPTSLFEEFVRISLESPITDIYSLIEFYTKICTPIRRRFIAADIMLRHFDAVKQLLRVIHDSIGPAGLCELPFAITNALTRELPTLEQARAFHDCLHGSFICHIDAVTHVDFWEEFKRIAGELEFLPVERPYSRTEFACVVIDKNKVPVVRHMARGADIFSELDNPKTKPPIIPSTQVWYQKRQYLSVIVRILWGDWLKNKVRSWNQLPQLFKHLLMTLPGTFATTLTRLDILTERNWFDQLCMPYFDRRLYTSLVPAGVNLIRDRASWSAVVFFATIFLRGWRPESQSLPAETWLSLMDLYLRDPKFANSMRPLPDHLKLMRQDLAAFANALRALYYHGKQKCLYKILALLDVFFGSMSAVLNAHEPRVHSTRGIAKALNQPLEPILGRRVEFQIITLAQLRLCLYNLFREHEFLVNKWNATTHQVIYFKNSGVSLLDLVYTIEKRMNAVSDTANPWPKNSWRIFFLDNDAIAAVVPKQQFHTQRLKTLLFQRLTNVSTRVAEGLITTTAATKEMVEIAYSDQFIPLPIYPHITQCFFSAHSEMVYLAILALESWISVQQRKTLPTRFAEIPGIILPQNPAFSFYHRLPRILFAITDPELAASGLGILQLFQSSFSKRHCVFKAGSTPKLEQFDHIKVGTPCFVTGLLSFLKLHRPHYLTRSAIDHIVSELAQLPDYIRRAAEPVGVSIEASVEAILRYCRTDEDESEGFIQLPMAMEDDQENLEDKNQKDKPFKEIPYSDPDSKGQQVAIKWPPDCCSHAYAKTYLAHAAFYDLLLKPYIPLHLRLFIFHNLQLVMDKPVDREPMGIGAPMRNDAWQSTDLESAVFARKTLNAPDLPPLQLRPSTESEADSKQHWAIMTEMMMVAEYSRNQVRGLTGANFKITGSNGDQFWKMNMNAVTFVVDPRVARTPFSVFNNTAMWANNDMIVFDSPWSSQRTFTNTPRQLFSPSDKLMNHLMTAYHDEWRPAPFDTDEALKNLIAPQTLSFSLHSFVTEIDAKDDSTMALEGDDERKGQTGSSGERKESVSMALVPVGQKRSRSESDLAEASNKQPRVGQEESAMDFTAILREARKDVQTRSRVVHQFWHPPTE